MSFSCQNKKQARAEALREADRIRGFIPTYVQEGMGGRILEVVDPRAVDDSCVKI